jgi:REP element-mobilizing transposase RayT
LIQASAPNGLTGRSMLGTAVACWPNQNTLPKQRCLLHDDGERYALAAWCVMPNHMHVLVEQFDGHPLADIVQTWKSVSAHTINKAQGRNGPLWRREYFDRFMRSEEQFAWTVA